MSAETTFYVKIVRGRAEWVPVSALTPGDAKDKALSLHGVISVRDAMHWTEFELRDDD